MRRWTSRRKTLRCHVWRIKSTQATVSSSTQHTFNYLGFNYDTSSLLSSDVSSVLGLGLGLKAKIQVLGLDTSNPWPWSCDLSPWPWPRKLSLALALALTLEAAEYWHSCCSASSSPAERVFCKRGLTVRPHHAKISDKHLESSVFARFSMFIWIL